MFPRWARPALIAPRINRVGRQTFSFHNICLIARQRPDATRVAGFHAGRKLGRFVRKAKRVRQHHRFEPLRNERDRCISQGDLDGARGFDQADAGLRAALLDADGL